MIFRAVNMWDSIPPELFDGNTYAWYNFATNITKDAENRISQVEDLSGNLRHLLQASSDAKPLWSVDGATFDGIDDYMQSSGWNLPKPTTVYVVVRRPLPESTFYFDGLVANQLHFGSYAPSRPLIRSGASSIVWSMTNIDTGIRVFALKYDGTNSFIRVAAEKQTGTTAAATTTGLTIGASPDFSVFSRMIFKEIIFRNYSDSVDVENAIMESLIGRY